MGTGYVRQSAADIVTGNVIEATPLNAEFNQLRDAFHESSGHSHDGTTGEGPKIDASTSLQGVLAVANGGVAGIHKTDATTAPTANDDSGDGYAVGSHWLDTTNDRAYVCVDASAAAAVWRYYGSAAASALAGTTAAADKVPYFTSASAASTFDATSYGRSLLNVANEAAFKALVNLEIGTDVQAYDAELAALAGLTSAADKVPYFTGSGTAGVADFTAYGRSLVAVANEAAFKSLVNLEAGVDYQAWDADLDALAALSGTNTIYYRSAANTWTAVTIGGNLTFTGGTLDAVAGSLDAELAAIAGLTSAADRVPYFTGSGTAALATFTSYGRSVVAVADEAAFKALVNLEIGTDVQAYDADLAAVAALATTGLIARTGAGTVATRTLTAPVAGISVSNGNGVSGNPTLALANDLAALEALSGTNTIYYRSAADTWTAVTIGSGLTFSAGTLDTASAGGMVLLGTLTTNSGTTQSLTGIAAGYREFYVELENVSHDAGASRQLTLAISSTNGGAYGSAVNISALQGAGTGIGGTLRIGNVSSAVTSGKSYLCASNSASVLGGNISTDTAADVDAIQFAWSGSGNFDAGTIRIYGVS